MFFLYGPWGHAPLLQVVTAASVAPVEATLPHHALVADPKTGLPVLIADETADLAGVVLDPDADTSARLEFYAAALGADWTIGTVRTSDGDREAQVLRVPGPGEGEAWSQERWVDTWSDVEVRVATEIMERYGQEAPERVGRHLEQARVRATSWSRAHKDSAPVHQRSGLRATSDVKSHSVRTPYRNFFMSLEHDVAFRRFDGRMNEPVTRAGFVMGDAATVLPYDPVRDRVLLVEQFRFGPYLRGDQHPWSLEPIAGRIDPGETPEDAAHREAQEEAGLTLQALEPVARYYPSPGAVTEYLYTFVGLADLPDNVARIAGLESEDEDIRGLLLPFSEALQLVTQGEAENGPLITTLFWLALNRDRLRGG